jgi:hypothetical protein
MAPSGHSKYGASKAKQWLACPASVKVQQGLHAAPSPYAIEGSAAHALAERCLLQGRWTANGFEGSIIEVDGSRVIVKREMVKAVNAYLDTVATIWDCSKPYNVETRFHLKDIHPDMYGTNDFSCLNLDGTLHVVDYKHGAGVRVECEDNPQLLYYGLGAGAAWNWRGVERVALTVVQPRYKAVNGPSATWWTDPARLVEFARECQVGIARCEAPNPPRVAGDHCRFCLAKPTCPAYAEFASPAKSGRLKIDEQFGIIEL